MAHDRRIFCRVLNELMTERKFKAADLVTGSKESPDSPIPKSTMYLYLDENETTDVKASHYWWLIEKFNTTPYYMSTGRGPKYANPSVADKMVDILEAYTDTKRPAINVLINMLLKMDYEQVKLIKRLTVTVAEDDPHTKAFERTPAHQPGKF